MVDNARSANVKLLARKLGGTEINIVLNTSVRSASRKYGLRYEKAATVVLISLVHEAEDRGREQLETEIRKALEKGLGSIR